ncbi:unnamed protein product [Schistosoma bovis]|nr:unnamed protein product [Schistosoma intercalatum]CAH8431212.1 unnamed protein product [Schistosoma intercalatum]CAH8431592.1 unnamed protein product [Schistosoma curassoni]CAH8431728.1 unnamed protein product [Schistosoma bovis]CAH8431807.1 unnamed protein product [Schistosoma bovis]
MRYKNLDISILSMVYRLISSLTLLLLFMIQTKGYVASNNGVLIQGLKFTEPCPERGYDFNDPTGNFMCVVPTPKECFNLCQNMGCTEWNHMNLIPSGSEEIKRYHRCRCFPEYNMCFYNYVPKIHRNFD